MRQKAKDSVTVRLPRGLKSELVRIALWNNATLTEVMTTALEQWVRCHDTVEDENESGTASSRESMPVA